MHVLSQAIAHNADIKNIYLLIKCFNSDLNKISGISMALQNK